MVPTQARTVAAAVSAHAECLLERSAGTTVRKAYISALLDEVTPFRSYRINPALHSRLDHLRDMPLEHISLGQDCITTL
jgi:hypothetical protein